MLYTDISRWQYYASNYISAPSATTPATEFTAGGSNADGAAVSCLSALAQDAMLISISIGAINNPTVDTSALLDVLVDPAGGTSWSELISDLLCGFSTTPLTTATLNCVYIFPLVIRAGSSIGVRCRTASASDVTNNDVVIQVWGQPSRPELVWAGQKVETLGVTAASSIGTDITPGASGTYSAWTNVGSVTSARYRALQFGVNGTDNVMAANTWRAQIGYNSTALPGTEGFEWSTSTDEVLRRQWVPRVIHCNIPAGTQMQARMTVGGAAGESADCAIYGVY